MPRHLKDPWPCIGLPRMPGERPVEPAGSPSARELVLGGVAAAGIELTNPGEPGRYLLVVKVDDDSLSDRLASLHRNEAGARAAITAVPPGWWPDCLIGLEARVGLAVRDAAAGDGKSPGSTRRPRTAKARVETAKTDQASAGAEGASLAAGDARVRVGPVAASSSRLG